MSEAARQHAFALFQQGRWDESQGIARDLLRADPGDAQLWLLDGLVSAKRSRFSEAEASLTASLQRQKSYQVLLSLGQVYLLTKVMEKAERCLVEAIAFQADSAEARVLLGNLYANQGKFEQALVLYRWLDEHGLADANLYGNMALTLESLRRPEEAARAAGQAVARDARHPVANLVLARLDRGAGRLDQAKANLRAVCGLHPTTPEGASLLTELGHVHDRSGEFAEAFGCFQQANTLWQRLVAEASSAKRIYLDRIRLNQAFFQTEWPGGDADLAGSNLVFLVGFPRSGTTLIEEILNTRTTVATTQEEPLVTELISELTGTARDPAAYPAVIGTLDGERLAQLRNRYLTGLYRVTGRAAPDTVYVDKLPLNIIEVGFMQRLFPAARFLVALRDPRDVCLSCFMQSFRLNPAMIHFLDIEDTARFYAAVMGLWNHYKTVLGNLRYLEYRYEDLVGDFDTTSKRILEFLGIDWTPDIRAFHAQASTRVVRTPSSIDVASPLYTRAIGRWKQYASQIGAIEATLRPFVVQFGYPE